MAWNSERLGKALEAHRVAASLSAEQLAHETGVDSTTIRKIERGLIGNPGSLTLQALADALGISLSDLFADASPDTPATPLPSLNPYLRLRYPSLSTRQITQITEYFEFVQARYGAHRPAEGDDER